MSGGPSTEELYARFHQLDQQEKQLGYGNYYEFPSSNVYSSSPLLPQVPPHQDFKPRRLPITPDTYSSATFPSSTFNQYSSPHQAVYTSPAYNGRYEEKPGYPKLEDDQSFGQIDEFGFEKNAAWMNEVDLGVLDETGHARPLRSQKPETDRKYDIPQEPKVEDDGEVAITPAHLQLREQKALQLAERRLRDTGEAPDRPQAVNGIQPMPITDLKSPELEAVFENKFKWFNPVQSHVFPVAFESDENLVVSAPTGSGKTTIFDLTILRMIETSDADSLSYAIYLAPTKALCGERTRDWRARLEHLRIKCSEVTGDTTSTWAIDRAVQDSRLIITTPEKWEAVTRHGSTLGERGPPALVMIDEVHFVRDDRGATLEVLISRMKSQDAQTRFVALSATVPNMDDIARWLIPASNTDSDGSEGVGNCDARSDGKNSKHIPVKDMPKARVFQFGEDFRPVKLLRHVVGVQGGNEFALIKRLEAALWPTLVKYSESKPVLVFCSTRRACQSVADHIATRYMEEMRKGTRKLPWQHEPINQQHQHDPNARIRIADQRLRNLVTCGVAFHHAGLEASDRREVEERFLDGRIKMIACTSTLAVGVNLPAHTVVILGTSAWQGPVAGFKEYSDIDVQQMMGRAGRPQFDRTGTCVVMCDKNKEQKYRDLVNSRTIVESALHSNLVDHVNTEIGLGTIKSLETAKKWLRNSFLFIRIQQNPRHYSTLGRKTHGSWEATLDHHVEEAIAKLESKNLIEWSVPEEDDDSAYQDSTEEQSPKRPRELKHTAYGKIMSDYVICFHTMSHIMNVQSTTTVRGLLELLAAAAEFGDLRVRPGENRILNLLRKHPDIRYPLDDPPESYADKVFLHLQAGFGNVTIDDEKKNSEVTSMVGTQIAIFKDAARIMKAIANVARLRGWGRTSKNAIELLHTVHGKAWEDTEVVFRQIPTIGPKSIGKLGQNNIKTFDDLAEAPTHTIETLLGRTKAPTSTPGGSSAPNGFGEAVKSFIQSFPRYHVTLQKLSLDKQPGRYPIAVIRIDLKPKSDWKSMNVFADGHSDANKTSTYDPKSARLKKPRRPNYNLTILTMRTDGLLFDLRRTNAYTLTEKLSTFTLECELKDSQHKIEVYAGVDELAGCGTKAVLDLKLDAFMFEDAVSQCPSEEDTGDEDDVNSMEVKPVRSHPSNRSSHDTVKSSRIQRESPSQVVTPVDARHRVEGGPTPRKRSHTIKVSKPRASSQLDHKPKREPASQHVSDIKPKSKLVPRSSTQLRVSRPKKERSPTPNNVMQYLDTEAIESDDEGADEYNTDDEDFIDDMHERSADRKPVKTARRSRDQVTNEQQGAPQNGGKRKTLTKPSIPAPPAKTSQPSSSEDFSGIEDVEVVLGDGFATQPKGEPLFLSGPPSDTDAPNFEQPSFDHSEAHGPQTEDVKPPRLADTRSSGRQMSRSPSQKRHFLDESDPKEEVHDEYEGEGEVQHHADWQGPDLATQQDIGDWDYDDEGSPLDDYIIPHPREPEHRHGQGVPQAQHDHPDESEDESYYSSDMGNTSYDDEELRLAPARREVRFAAGQDVQVYREEGHQMADDGHWPEADKEKKPHFMGHTPSQTPEGVAAPRRVDPYRQQASYDDYDQDGVPQYMKREASISPSPLGRSAGGSYSYRQDEEQFAKREPSYSSSPGSRQPHAPHGAYEEGYATHQGGYGYAMPERFPTTPPKHQAYDSQTSYDGYDYDQAQGAILDGNVASHYATDRHHQNRSTSPDFRYRHEPPAVGGQSSVRPYADYHDAHDPQVYEEDPDLIQDYDRHLESQHENGYYDDVNMSDEDYERGHDY